MAAFKKLLFVDDDAITLAIAERLMKLVDFTETFVARKDGLEAIDYLTAEPVLPNIIFVDLYMHAMDGWKFIDWFKKWSAENGVRIPVYVLSSGIDTKFPENNHLDVVNCYILKPVTAENLKVIAARYAVNGY